MPRNSPLWSAGCYFWAPGGHARGWRQLPMVECEAHTIIKGSSTRTRLKQYFTNVNDDDIEKCQYAFPLYDGVSVVGFKCQIGGKLLEGVVKEREEAKMDFDAAVARGESAGLMEQNLSASDVFSTSLGNFPKGSTAVIMIEYIAELQHDLETDSLKFEMPTGIAPRYAGAHADSSYASIMYPCDFNQLPPAKGFEWTCDIEMSNAITKVESPTHAVSFALGQLSHEDEDSDPDFKKCSAKMTLQKESGLSKELILTVKAKGIKDPVALWETHPTLPSHTALMTTLVPNFKLPQIKPEVVFVCDRSGSMGGDPINTLVDAVRVMLHSLPANGIKFNICSFGSSHSFLFEKSQTYSRATLKQATEHVDGFSANFGGTETYGAIRATIERRYGDVPLEIILLTDGDIWNQQNLFTYLNERVAESKQQIRLFPLGIGHGVSTALIEGVARAGNGFPSTVMPGERMDQRCMRMLKAALSPHITDYKLEVLYQRHDEDEDDFEMVESVEAATELAIRSKNPGSAPVQAASGGEEAGTKSISLFDGSVDGDDTQMASVNANVPDLHAPKILQAPFKVPQLYAFKRTTVYLLLGPESARRTPKSVILKGTFNGTELKLEIPVLDTGRSSTVHQLAARRVVQDFEEGRGWMFSARTKDGKTIEEAHPSEWDDVIKKEAVRIGTTYQVMNRWCSYVARERRIDVKRTSGKQTAGDSATNDAANSVEEEGSDGESAFDLLDADDLELVGGFTEEVLPEFAQTASSSANQPATAAAANLVKEPRRRKGWMNMAARKSTGGKAPRKQVASSAAQSAVGDRDVSYGDYSPGPNPAQPTSYSHVFQISHNRMRATGHTLPSASSFGYTQARGQSLFGSVTTDGLPHDVQTPPSGGSDLRCANARMSPNSGPSGVIPQPVPSGYHARQQQQQQQQSYQLFSAAPSVARRDAAAAPATAGEAADGGLFGGSNPPQRQPTGGSTVFDNAPSPYASGMLCGVSRNASRQQASNSGSGLFGGSQSTPQATGSSGGLFGHTGPQKASSQVGSAFGSPASIQRYGGAGGVLFGGHGPTQQDPGSAVSVFARSAQEQGPASGTRSSVRREGKKMASGRGSKLTAHFGMLPASLANTDADADDDGDEEMMDAPAPSALPTFSDDAARVRALIRLQDFDGCWETGGKDGETLRLLAWILGVTELTLKIDPGVKGCDGAVWVTVCAVVWLEEGMKGEEEIWEMSVEKAEAWLEEREVGIKDIEKMRAKARVFFK